MSAKLGSWLIKHLSDWLLKDGRSARGFLSDYDKISSEIQPGDVLLVEGKNKASQLISILTNSAWTHAGIYIGRPKDYHNSKIRTLIDMNFQGAPNTQLIIEALPGKGTILRGLDCYTKDHIRICRPRGLRKQDAKIVIQFCLSRVGREYNYRQVLHLTLFLLPWRVLPRRWLRCLFGPNATDTAQSICSTMITEAFNEVDFPVLPDMVMDEQKKIILTKRNPRLCTPSDFDYSPFFAIIKYPIFDFSKHAPEAANLSWNHGKISNE